MTTVVLLDMERSYLLRSHIVQLFTSSPALREQGVLVVVVVADRYVPFLVFSFQIRTETCRKSDACTQYILELAAVRYKCLLVRLTLSRISSALEVYRPVRLSRLKSLP